MLSELNKLSCFDKRKHVVITNHENIFVYSVYNSDNDTIKQKKVVHMSQTKTRIGHCFTDSVIWLQRLVTHSKLIE